MSIDILEALAAEAPAPSSRKCRIQRWLDDIPADTPGLDKLVATITTTDPKAEAYRTVDKIDKVLFRLGFETSSKTIADHRAERCRCFQ